MERPGWWPGAATGRLEERCFVLALSRAMGWGSPAEMAMDEGAARGWG